MSRFCSQPCYRKDATNFICLNWKGIERSYSRIDYSKEKSREIFSICFHCCGAGAQFRTKIFAGLAKRADVLLHLGRIDLSDCGLREEETRSVLLLLDAFPLRELRLDRNSLKKGAATICAALGAKTVRSATTLSRLSLANNKIVDCDDWMAICRLMKYNRVISCLSLRNNQITMEDSNLVADAFADVLERNDALRGLFLDNCFPRVFMLTIMNGKTLSERDRKAVLRYRATLFAGIENNLSLTEYTTFPASRIHWLVSLPALSAMGKIALVAPGQLWEEKNIRNRTRLAVYDNFQSKVADTDVSFQLCDYLLRNAYFAWRRVFQRCFAFAHALAPLRLPIYIVLELFDWTEFFGQPHNRSKTPSWWSLLAPLETIQHFYRAKKVALIQGVANSFSKITALRN